MAQDVVLPAQLMLKGTQVVVDIRKLLIRRVIVLGGVTNILSQRLVLLRHLLVHPNFLGVGMNVRLRV